MSDANRQPNPARTFHWLAAIYILLLCATAISNSGLIKFVANAFAILIFVVLTINWAFLPKQSGVVDGIAVGLSVYYIGLISSVAINYNDANLVDTLKIGMAPIFTVFGASFSSQRSRWTLEDSNTRLLFAFMALLPLITLGYQKLTGSDESTQIFVNLNNAGLYAITLLAYYNVLSKTPINNSLIYMGVGIMFGTLGLFLAVFAAVVLCHRRWMPILAAPLLAAIALAIITSFPELSKTARVQVVVDSIVLMATKRISLETVTYAELVTLLQTQDLSFLFRLKHWLNLLQLYFEGDAWNKLFGFGTGASVRLTNIHLVPHNDYIRMAFEFGLVTLTGFILTIFYIIKNSSRGWILLPLLAVSIYFWSENLINNYIAMALFFFSAGAATAERKTLTEN